MVMDEGISESSGVEFRGGLRWRVMDSKGKVSGLGLPALCGVSRSSVIDASKRFKRMLTTMMRGSAS